jgi:hypothetical protein
MVVGPTPSDAPLFVAVTVTVPVEPGTIDGVVTDTATSALRAPAVTVELAVLLAGVGSVVALATAAVPPVSEPGAVEAASDTGIDTLAEAPLARVPATVHVTVPDASVQPDGSAPGVTPAGGV